MAGSEGYAILQRNWKHGRTEIDIIAEKNKQLHFIEVKTRTTDAFCFPEERINKGKLERIALARQEYLTLHPQYKEVIIDILSINIHSNKRIDYFLLEDARS